ncbi:hypothetical protein AB0I28_17230 [Phytomonospora sp. NPDC050363]|uniref:hypothetical protein n=1 Tax=Phytomonospora sp. NPDC050363 TaxID=3155642 RepID=UPI0033D82526
MTPAAAQPPPELVITCDESGYEGEKLVGGTTRLFVHGSVRISSADADECLRELRRRIKSPATEYKANHLLREKHLPVLRWILGPDGPLLGNAHIYLIDKTYFLLAKLIEVFDEPDDAAARHLLAEGPASFGAARWAAFLEAANGVLRIKERVEALSPIDTFFHMLDVLHRGGPLDRLRGRRERAESFRAGLAEDPAAFPVLDALIPAIERAVTHWSAGGAGVAVVHDRQNALSPERVVQLKELCPDLTGLSLSASFTDARVQLADIMAGTARRIIEHRLNGVDNPELVALFDPYADTGSLLVRT